MADETQKSKPLPNMNKEERHWAALMLIDEKPSEVYERFLETFPRFAEHADEHGIDDEELKSLIINRFYDINKERNLDPTGFMDKLSNPQFRDFMNDAVLYEMMAVKQLKRIHRENAVASETRNMSDEEKKDLKDRNKFVNENLKRVAQLNKLARDKVKFDILTQKVLPRGDTDPVQLKETQTPGQVDWDDDSWLEGDPGKANESD